MPSTRRRFPGPDGGDALLMTTGAEWRTWLERNHAAAREVWLVAYKKGSGKQSLDYQATLDEATCFGWVDGIIRGATDDYYLQRLVPRRARSSWNEANRARASRLVAAGLMTPAGIAALPADLRAALGLEAAG